MKLENRNSAWPEKLNNLASPVLPGEMREAILQDAQKLASTDPAESLMLKGLVDAYDGNVAPMRENFEKALTCLPPDASILHNYAFALTKTGLFSNAIALLQEIGEMNEKNCRIMGQCCLALGLNAKARQYLGPAMPKTDENSVPSRACSASAKEAMQCVLKSFDEDREIWQSLSTR